MSRGTRNSEDVLDIREVIERFEELEEELNDHLTTEAEGRRSTLEDQLQEEMKIELAELGNESDPDFDRWVEVKATFENSLGATAKEYIDLGDFEPKITEDWLAGVYETAAHVMNDEVTEYLNLKELLGDLAGYGGDEQWRGDWYPITLVRDDYFTKYAEQTAEDIGAISRDAAWPANCIDWEEAASQLKQDYSTVDYDGVTYWYR